MTTKPTEGVVFQGAVCEVLQAAENVCKGARSLQSGPAYCVVPTQLIQTLNEQLRQYQRHNVMLALESRQEEAQDGNG